MKRNIRIFAVLLVICMFMTSINVYALDTNKDVAEERIFTKAQLACMTDGSFGTATGLSDEFIEVKNIEGKSTRASTTYYIIETTDGYMLTSPTSGTFSRTRYANSGSNNVRKWIFTEDSDGDYIVYSYTDSTKCLTINPSTKAVTLSTYTGSEYQKWRMYYSGNGNTLRSMANDSTVSGYKLVINGSSCYVSNTTYTPVGFFDVSWYTPVSTLSYSNFYLALEQNKTVTPTKSPSDANCSNNWINWSSSNTSKFTVNDNGKVTGVSAGTATLTFRDKITRKYGTCTITVMPIANGTYYLKNRENSDYAKVKNATMSNGNNVVQYDFGEEMEFRWVFTLNTTTGYYSIKSDNSSSTNYYMAVSDDSSALDKPIVIRSATETSLTDGMQWKAEATTNGAYKIIPKTGEATNYVLATSVSNGTNNKNLLQGDYLDNNSYRDEWFVQPVNCSLPTPLIGQKTSMWCWAASAEMLARTKHPTAANNGNASTIEQEQRDAVYHVFGNSSSSSSTYDWSADPQGLKSKGGVYFDVANAAAFLVGEVNGDETFSGYATPYSEEDLVRFLLDGHAVARLYGWATVTWTPPTTLDELVAALNNLNPNVGGHVTVITGITWSTTEQCYIYTVNDPWSGGSQVQYTYGELLFDAVYSGGQYEVSFWFPTVVTKTEYSNKTLIENIIGKDYSSN